MVVIILGYALLVLSPFSIVFQQNMRVTRQIVLPLLTKALYKFGCFKGILQKAKLALLLFYWVAQTRFCMWQKHKLQIWWMFQFLGIHELCLFYLTNCHYLNSNWGNWSYVRGLQITKNLKSLLYGQIPILWNKLMYQLFSWDLWSL